MVFAAGEAVIFFRGASRKPIKPARPRLIRVRGKKVREEYVQLLVDARDIQ